MPYGRRLPLLAASASIVLLVALGLALFSAPMDVDQGFSQKIFYVHVPMAIIALGGFVAGGIFGAQHLRTGDPRSDLRSYVCIHLSVVLGVGVLATGMIWAKAAWGVWFEWREPTLVSFLIIFLLYCTYQPLRFSIEDPDRQRRYASVFAVIAGAFTPIAFTAVRLGQSFIHPKVLNEGGADLPAGMKAPFYLAIVGMLLLFVALYRYELSHKHARARVRSLRRKLGGDLAPVGRSAAPQVHA